MAGLVRRLVVFLLKEKRKADKKIDGVFYRKILRFKLIIFMKDNNNIRKLLKFSISLLV